MSENYEAMGMTTPDGGVDARIPSSPQHEAEDIIEDTNITQKPESVTDDESVIIFEVRHGDAKLKFGILKSIVIEKCPLLAKEISDAEFAREVKVIEAGIGEVFGSFVNLLESQDVGGLASIETPTLEVRESTQIMAKKILNLAKLWNVGDGHKASALQNATMKEMIILAHRMIQSSFDANNVHKTRLDSDTLELLAEFVQYACFEAGLLKDMALDLIVWRLSENDLFETLEHLSDDYAHAALSRLKLGLEHCQNVGTLPQFGSGPLDLATKPYEFEKGKFAREAEPAV